MGRFEVHVIVQDSEDMNEDGNPYTYHSVEQLTPLELATLEKGEPGYSVLFQIGSRIRSQILERNPDMDMTEYR